MKDVPADHSNKPYWAASVSINVNRRQSCEYFRVRCPEIGIQFKKLLRVMDEPTYIKAPANPLP